jgi:hypothetical protein
LNRRVARPNPQLAIDPVRAPDRFAALDEAKLVSIIFSMVRTKGTAAFRAPRTRRRIGATLHVTAERIDDGPIMIPPQIERDGRSISARSIRVVSAFSAPKLRQTPTIYDQLTRQASLFRVEKHFDNHFPLFLAPAGNLRLPGIAR